MECLSAVVRMISAAQWRAEEPSAYTLWYSGVCVTHTNGCSCFCVGMHSSGAKCVCCPGRVCQLHFLVRLFVTEGGCALSLAGCMYVQHDAVFLLALAVALLPGLLLGIRTVRTRGRSCQQLSAYSCTQLLAHQHTKLPFPAHGSDMHMQSERHPTQSNA